MMEVEAGELGIVLRDRREILSTYNYVSTLPRHCLRR